MSCVEILPSTETHNTDAIIDAMSMIHRYPFQKDEEFGEYANRLQHKMLSDLPPGSDISLQKSSTKEPLRKKKKKI